jgi:hypothetical protein
LRHALTPANLKESIERGADFQIPKDELANLCNHVVDVIRSRLEGNTGGHDFPISNPFLTKLLVQAGETRNADSGTPLITNTEDKIL